ncbi:MAG: hypothetical protein HC925_04370 [Coleofasciculaceae cyanobacterium SM2_3_26]|nr:hypothetical protein [Coleofasciculaceae cyanobacterium SM2_3_26]
MFGSLIFVVAVSVMAGNFLKNASNESASEEVPPTPPPTQNSPRRSPTKTIWQMLLRSTVPLNCWMPSAALPTRRKAATRGNAAGTKGAKPV